MDLLIDLLFLIVLAAMANQSKRPYVAGALFGLLKAVSINFAAQSEMLQTNTDAAILTIVHLLINGALGTAIAFMVIKHSSNAKMMVFTLVLSVLSFLTHHASFNILSLF